MTLLFPTMTILMVAALVALHFYSRLRRLSAVRAGHTTANSTSYSATHRYLPMQRLLSVEDEALVASNKPLARQLRKQRIAIFRAYLSCLSVDYGRLLAGVRASMAGSSVDRADLAASLAKSQALFTLNICRIEYRLFMHSLGLGSVGLGSVDVSGLVEGIAALRSQFAALTPVMAGAH